MPLFEYACLECGVEFEKLVARAGDASQVACPMCGSRKIDLKISTFASPVSGGASGSCASGSG
jgi:putative FmdB family regulatory protein